MGTAANLPKLWTTVYAGNLPYEVSSDSLRYLIESHLGDEGQGAIAGVRLAQDQETGKPRGFAHIDFFEKSMAEKAVKQLAGISIMERTIKLDIEKDKNPFKAKSVRKPEKDSRKIE